MFARSIKSVIHPATWAVVGAVRKGKQVSVAHRGTAFAVDSNGHLVTCWHVTFMDQDCKIPCNDFLVVQPETKVQYPAKLVASERDRDVALLKIAAEGVKTRYARLVNRTVAFGASACAFGHPLSITDPKTSSMRIFARAAAGVVSMPFEGPRFPNSRPVRLYELDFFTHGGSSGGPVFLRRGHVFAFVSGSRLLDDGSGKQQRSNLTLAVDIREAIEFLDALGVKLKTSWGVWP